MKSNNIIFNAPQRSSEFARGEYYSTIDLLEHAERQSADIEKIREKVVDSYKHGSPELFTKLDHFSDKLTSMNMDIVNELQGCVYQLENINSALDQISYTLGYGFESLANRLDKTNVLLGDIREILSSPVATQATEFLARAQNFFKDGFYEEAEEDLENVVTLDKANYVSWYLLGLIRSENLGNKDGALEALEKCEKYASVRNKHYFSKALLQRALIVHAIDKDLELAISLTAKSVSTDFSNKQAKFFLAELYAEQGDIEIAGKYLQLCEPIDVIFYYRSANSTSLVQSGVHAHVYNTTTKALKTFNEETMNVIESYRLSVMELDKTVGGDLGLANQINDVCTMVREGSSEDYLLQRSIHDGLKKRSRQIGLSVENSLKKLQENISLAQIKTKQSVSNIKKRSIGRTDSLFFPIVFILIVVLVFPFISEILELLTEFREGSFSDKIIMIFALIIIGVILYWPIIIIGGAILVMAGVVAEILNVSFVKFQSASAGTAGMTEEKKSKEVYDGFSRKLGGLLEKLGGTSGRDWYLSNH